VVGGYVRVQDAECPDDLRLRVGERRDGDVLPLVEILENLDGVVGDYGNPQPFLAELICVMLQLDELRLAVRSPVR